MNSLWLLLFLLGISSQNISATENMGHAIQIMAPINHTFHLELNELKQILEADAIKDRHVVVVSIAGAYRQGKSFILNFFIKFLEAQYKKHNVNDWLGETVVDSKLDGFKWRGGRKRETVGIWMWSDVFTHDFPNGEKVAIILLDTQGIFDDRSSMLENTATFALSMMLSSVQCYNLMQNIKEDDLQHLQLFSEYGRLALEQTNQKPFQNLTFIVRDWPFAFETPYGDGQKIIDEIFTENDEQAPEMRELRKQIARSFEKVSGFLMPHPGLQVANSAQFTGDLQQISTEFKDLVKVLVPMLFAPENLIVKQINGEKVRAKDLSQFVQAYTNIFNNGALPEPKTVLMATAEASNLILHNDCLEHYSNAMSAALLPVQPFMSENDLNGLHQKVKSESVAKFLSKPKLGGEELRATYQQKIETGIEQRFAAFKSENEKKRQHFIEKANLHNVQISGQIIGAAKAKIVAEIANSSPELNIAHLNGVSQASKQAAVADFDNRKMGDETISGGHRIKLIADLDQLINALTQTLNSYGQVVHFYAIDSMQKMLNDAPYFTQADLLTHHQNKKNEAVNQFQSQALDNDFKAAVVQKIVLNIDQRLPHFQAVNEGKRNEFLQRANAHSDQVHNEMRAAFDNKVRSGIGRSFLSDEQFINLFISSKQSTLNEYAGRKMGEDELSNVAHNNFRVKLEQEMDGLQVGLKQVNENNRPPPPRRKKKKFLGIFG